MLTREQLLGLDSAALQSEIDDARRAYADARADLLKAVGETTQNPGDVADALLEAAEEFGADHALHLLQAELERIGAGFDGRGSHTDLESLRDRMETLLDARDRLDRAAGVQFGTKAVRLIHVDGKPFAANGDMLQSIERADEHYRLDVEPVVQPMPTSSEQMRAVAAVDLAEPRIPEPRNRSR